VSECSSGSIRYARYIFSARRDATQRPGETQPHQSAVLRRGWPRAEWRTANNATAITADGSNFTLTGDGVSYLFHVDPSSLDLVSDHYGGPATDFTPPANILAGGWSDGLTNTRREFPDVGRSDYRVPAIHIKHADGDTISAFAYKSYEITAGKPALSGLPATYGGDSDVSTLKVHMYDNYSDIEAVLSYSIFPKYNAIARSFQISNNGTANISIERAASFSIDLPNLDLNMIELQGDWAHEMVCPPASK